MKQKYRNINTNLKKLKTNVFDNRGVHDLKSNKDLKRPEKRKISEKEVMESILKIKYCFEILFQEVGIKDFTFFDSGHEDDIDVHEDTVIEENNSLDENESDLETSDRSEDNILISNKFIRASDNTNGKMDDLVRSYY